MKKEKQFELLSNLPTMIRQNNVPEPENYDDARFFVEQGNILWIYHDEDAPEESTICRYELAMDDFVTILENFLENGDVGCIFDDMEEKCTAHTSATIENPLYQKLEKLSMKNRFYWGRPQQRDSLRAYQGCIPRATICRYLQSRIR